MSDERKASLSRWGFLKVAGVAGVGVQAGAVVAAGVVVGVGLVRLMTRRASS
jgi:hypothetical protein